MKKKVLIVTFKPEKNYGGIMQAYALQHTLNHLGAEATTTGLLTRKLKLRFGLSKIKQAIVARKLPPRNYAQKTKQFVADHIQLIDIFSFFSKNKSLDEYDLFVVGSDQVWRGLYSDIPMHFFSFLQGDHKKRISYAASFGKDDIKDEYTAEDIASASELIKKFSGVSVREDSGVDICKRYFDYQQAQHHIDPTLILTPEDYSELINQDTEPSDYDGKVLSYVLDYSQESLAIINKVADELGLEPCHFMGYGESAKRPLKSVYQWLKAFRDSSFVVTDSFHGTAFSIIFNKPFVAIGNKSRGLGRFKSILNMFNLSNRMVFSADELSNELLHENIEWSKINDKIEAERAKSLAFLKRSLED